MTVSSRAFPHAKLAGSHREVGFQHGATFKDLIAQHLDQALTNLAKRGVSRATALTRAGKYQPFVKMHTSFLDEEIQGVAEGAALSLEEAYLLQLRAEVAHTDKDHPGDECTTYAVEPAATKNGEAFLGQNADLPPFYAELGVVVEISVPDKPAVMMFTPAGQVSYIGMTSTGFAAGGNYLTCGGWREGFPRYLLTRTAMTCETVDDAAKLLDRLPRASSRNIIMLDPNAKALDLESAPRVTGAITSTNDIIAHANHFISDIAGEELAAPRDLENSQIRQSSMRRLLEAEHGSLTLTDLIRVMRNRDAVPDALCRHPGEGPGATSTVAAMIAQPAQQTLWVAVGPPDQHKFYGYTFGQTEVKLEREVVTHV